MTDLKAAARVGTADDTLIQLPDGRQLAYTIRGIRASSRSKAIVWLHGIVSSRWECSATGLDVLAQLDAYVVAFDRPGYGCSSPHRQRTFRSFVQARTLVLAQGLPRHLHAGACR